MLGVFAARRGVARMYRRIFRVLFAVSVLALTSGCETVSGILAELFGDSPVAAPEPEPQAPQLADRIVVRKSKRTLELLHDGALFESFPMRSVASRAAQNKKRVMAARRRAST
jgi:hypothetical protein